MLSFWHWSLIAIHQNSILVFFFHDQQSIFIVLFVYKELQRQIFVPFYLGIALLSKNEQVSEID